MPNEGEGPALSEEANFTVSMGQLTNLFKTVKIGSTENLMPKDIQSYSAREHEEAPDGIIQYERIVIVNNWTKAELMKYLYSAPSKNTFSWLSRKKDVTD